MSEKFCGDCDFNRNGLCIVHRWDVSKESPICSVYRGMFFGTVFQKITASPEVLAKKTVHPIVVTDLCTGEKRICYYSPLIDRRYDNEAEAIAETVEKLKEVCNE